MAQQAQKPDCQADAEELSEVVVTGYRASLKAALEIKRNSELVVDAISGGDIGALPDVTIAESLVRLPGINGTRDRGNQSQAAMRGLGPRLVLGLVNGREVASSEPSRNVRWEIYPSEVVSGVDVYKSQSADLVAGGVAGTIDIKTIRPLDYSGPEVQFRGGPVYYEAGSDIPDYDPYGFSRQRQLHAHDRRQLRIQPGCQRAAAEECVSVIPGLGLQRRQHQPRQRHRRYRRQDGVPNPTPWGAQTEVKKLTEDRFGVNGAIGWRVGDNFELNVDALYSGSPSTKTRTRPGTAATDHGQLGNGKPTATTARSPTTPRWARPWSGHARQLLGVSHQRDRASTPKTRICSSPARMPSEIREAGR